MIVDHPDCLHVAVDRGGPHEAESSPLQIATECVGLRRRGGNLAHGFPSILPRAAVDELPAIRVEAAAFFPAAAILMRLRMIPGSVVSLSTRAAEYRATFSGLKSLKARR